MLTVKKDKEHYLVYLNGKFIASCDNYIELRETYAEFGIII